MAKGMIVWMSCVITMSSTCQVGLPIIDLLLPASTSKHSPFPQYHLVDPAYTDISCRMLPDKLAAWLS